MGGGKENKRKIDAFVSLVLEKLLNDNDPQIVFVNKLNGIQEGKIPRSKKKNNNKQQMENFGSFLAAKVTENALTV